jgi:hypothetical protein
VVPAGRDDSTATFTIRNLPSGQCVLDYMIIDTSSWLRVRPESGLLNPNQTATIRVYATVHDYPVHAELYSTLIVRYFGAGSPYSVPVDVIITEPGQTNEPGEILPTEFSLRQNYPNPFNPSTQLRFDVPKESRVDIVIYNVMGQEVAHPVAGVYQAGRYGVNFKTGNLPTGMYLMRMHAGDFVGIGKMMLLK